MWQVSGASHCNWQCCGQCCATIEWKAHLLFRGAHDVLFTQLKKPRTDLLVIEASSESFLIQHLGLETSKHGKVACPKWCQFCPSCHHPLLLQKTATVFWILNFVNIKTYLQIAWDEKPQKERLGIMLQQIHTSQLLLEWHIADSFISKSIVLQNKLINWWSLAHACCSCVQNSSHAHSVPSLCAYGDTIWAMKCFMISKICIPLHQSSF